MKESQFQFRNPYLVEASFVINYAYDGEKPTNILQNLETEVNYNDDRTSALVSLSLIISAEENKPFDLKLVYVSEFRWGNDLEENQYQELLKVNAPTLLLSYMRPMVASLTSASPLPVYQLPFMDFTSSNGDV